MLPGHGEQIGIDPIKTGNFFFRHLNMVASFHILGRHPESSQLFHNRPIHELSLNVLNGL
jgi:hypothetical protein